MTRNPKIWALMLVICAVFSGCATRPVEATQNPDGSQTVKVVVRQGYHPASIEAKAGKPLKVEFYRDETEGHSCDEELVIPSENIRMKLPSRQSRIVEIKAHPPGELPFHCGMDMLKGKIIFK